MKTRACYGEIVAYDLNTNEFVKLEGGPTALATEKEQKSLKLTPD